MSERECPTGIKFLIGDRFFYSVSTFDVHQAFDFFKNYAPFVTENELKKAWKCYKKSGLQTSDSTWKAFWEYMDGKKIKLLNRKGGVFCCVPE